MYLKKWFLLGCITTTYALPMDKQQLIKINYGTYQIVNLTGNIQQPTQVLPTEETSRLSKNSSLICSSTKTLCVALGTTLCGSGFIGAGVYALSHDELAGSIFLFLTGGSIVLGGWYNPIRHVFGWCANN